MIYSPLRYPGGKSKLSAFVAKICIDNGIDGHYVEPYSGGASVALFLLLEGFVERITINDKDRSIYAFWYSVINKNNQLCSMIEDAELSIEEWKKQREVQRNKKTADLLTLGFSTFYLNRTNRSGIIRGGVMGGLKQNGNYLMDCRFNKVDLIQRIKNIAKHKKNIRLYKKDAVKLIDKIEKEGKDENVIFYFDPPYYLKASSLYLNHYKDNNHKDVSERIKSIKNIKWIVSYDNVPQIRELYANCPTKEFSFKHTAYKIREGKEVMFFSSNIKTPQMDDWTPLNFKLKRSEEKSSVIYKEKRRSKKKKTPPKATILTLF